MPRSYRHIKQYEKEILELRKQGLTHREIGEKYGLRKEQIKKWVAIAAEVIDKDLIEEVLGKINFDILLNLLKNII